MPMRSILIAALVAIATTAVGATAATAQTLNTGDFSVVMPMPGETSTGAGQEPNCTPSIQTVALSGGTANCTMNRTLTGDTATGTVANATLAGQYGEAFNQGTMTRTCDLTQNMSMQATFAAGAMTSMSPPTMTMSGTMVMGCSFKMSFPDSAGSSLSGTMTLNASMSTKDLQGGGISGADIQMTLKVDVTEGTGIFAGYTGTGELDAAQAFSLLGGAGGAPGGGGAGGGGSAPPSGGGSGTPPSGDGNAQLQAFCAANGITDCSTAGLNAWCAASPANAAACQAAFGRSSRSVGSARQSSTADTLTLKLVKTNAKGTVRIISPVAGTGKNIATVNAKTKVKIVATKGAQCTVKASTGKVVGKATSKDSSKTLTIKAKKGSLTKAKWLQATCTLDGGSFSSAKVRVKG